MDKTNFPKKSPTNSQRNKRSTVGSGHDVDEEHERYYDRTMDMVARIRAAKEAAQRQMEEFGDPSEYEVRIIRGMKKNTPETEQAPPQTAEALQSSLEFPAESPADASASDSKESV